VTQLQQINASNFNNTTAAVCATQQRISIKYVEKLKKNVLSKSNQKASVIEIIF